MHEPKQYRKQPLVIEAMLNDGSAACATAIISWASPHVDIGSGYDGALELDISTLEGIMTAAVGDYIIKGIGGEFYPCKPGIFHQTYEQT